MNAPLMLVGHGTVDATGVAEFVAFTDRLRRRLATEQVDVDGGFIELSQPTVHEAWTALAGRGHTTMAAVPMVLVGAGHAKGDIPAALQREVVRDPSTGYVFGRPLGPHPALQAILDERITAALGEDPADGTAVLLVGRGSTDPDANAEVSKVARLLQEGRQYDFVEPAYVSLSRPDVASGLARCRALGARRVVVAPYFLLTGCCRVGSPTRPGRSRPSTRTWTSGRRATSATATSSRASWSSATGRRSRATSG